MHALSVFIVLGIAADDIFVFVDGWRQSAANSYLYNDPRKRLSYAFKRAARATATTSCTTAAAFMANIANPIMPMASFGIYAGTLVIVVYLIIVLFFPPIIIYHD